MAIPKPVVKINKNGIQYESRCDRTAYTLRELTRAALRETGKYICKMFRDSYYSNFKKNKGRVGKATQYWVRTKSKTPDLQVGIKPNGFYGGFQEFGSSKVRGLGLLSHATQDNIAEIVKIQSQYLSSLEDEAKALSMMQQGDEMGGAD